MVRNVTLQHGQLHGVFRRTEQGRVPIPHTLHGRALEHKVPLIMDSMHRCPAVAVARLTTLTSDVRRGDRLVHELGSSSWETSIFCVLRQIATSAHAIELSAHQPLENSMDRAAFAKLESAVFSSTFTQRCKCCDAKELVNQWHLTGHTAFCKKCLPTGTSPQDVLQVGGSQTLLNYLPVTLKIVA